MNDVALIAIVAALYVLGLVFTGWGLFNAVITTQRDLITAKQRIVTLERLESKHKAERAAVDEDLKIERAAFNEGLGRSITPDDNKTWNDRQSARLGVLTAQHDEEYAALDLVRATYGNLPRLAQYESQWVIQRLIDSNKINLVLLGVGIVMSTVASIWSLFL